MMRLVKLSVTNFMPYLHEQTVEFPTDPDRNIMLVFGDNMRGKTSFLNAIRWCLYGEALDRDRRPISLVHLANMDAVDKGDWTFGVRLTFEAGGISYDLRRSATPREFVSQPKRDSDFVITEHLLKGGTAVRADEIEHEINLLLPQQISRFFLFDAELLAEYEELLAQDSEQGRRIKEAIEQVLGVPSLIHGRRELKTLQRLAQEVLAKENRNSETMRSHSEHFSQLGSELEVLEKDQSELKTKESQAKAEIAALEADLARTEAAQRLHARLEGLIQERRRLAERTESQKQDRLDIVAGSWQDVLQPRLRAHVHRLEKERSDFVENVEGRGALRVRIDQLRSLLSSATCEVCDQAIAPDKREAFGRQLGALEAELDINVSSIERAGVISAEIARLSRISSTSALSRIIAMDADLDRAAVRMTEVEQEIADIRTEVESHDSAEVARKRARLGPLNLHLGRMQEEVDRVQKEIDEREAKRDQLSKLMTKAPSQRTQRSAREVEIYNSLERIFSKSIDRLRESLRKTVQARATDAFLKLTTEHTYSGLRLNENYGLTILDRDNRVVSVRSAGAEQIVALSLIDGLNRTAGKVGPIIIDTPLGRLDPKHRSNVLSYVATMSEQVVLLVHEGEIARDGGRDELESRIGCVYEIERVTSSHSRLTYARNQ